MQKKFLFFIIAAIFFGMSYLAGHYRVLPTHHLHSLKDAIELRLGLTEEPLPSTPEGVEFKTTLLTRLLVKKIPLSGYNGSGGGLTISGDLLFIISNKGGVEIYNTNTNKLMSAEIIAPPLNYEDLVSSGHVDLNGFREFWFRVNGLYSEQTGPNRFILYLSHNRYDEVADCISHSVSKSEIELKNGIYEQIDGWSTLFSGEPCFDPAPEDYVSTVPYSGHISGGAIQPYDDTKLLITVGDYNHHGLGDMPGFSQDQTVSYGKFILLDKFSGEWELFAKGTRNPSGLHIDQYGTIWSVENGPHGGDELNIILNGANYGWPHVSHGIWYSPEYKLQETAKTGRHSGFGFTDPVYSWVPSVAPSSIIRMEQDRFPLWKGDLLVGTMRGQGLRRLRIAPDNRVLYDEEIHFGHRIRDIATLDNGLILLLTDDEYLIILDNGGPSIEDPPVELNDRIAELEHFNNLSESTMNLPNAQSAGMIFHQNCSTCHSLDPSPGGIGPHLENLYGREVGSAGNFNYSEVLERDSRTWNNDLLRTFLTNPEAKFSGNRMSKVELSDSEIDSLVQFFDRNNPELN